MKNGIIDGVYYENGRPKHAGVIKIDGEIYYAGTDGKLAKGQKIVHRVMSNGILKHGTYKFDAEGKMVKDFYLKPKKRKKRRFHLPKLKKNDIIRIASVVAVAAVCVGLFFLIRYIDNEQQIINTELTEQTAVRLPSFDNEVYLCSDSLASYYKGETTFLQAVSSNQSAYKAFDFEYYFANVKSATLELEGKSYDLYPLGTRLTIDNLLTGKTYQYTVKIYEKNSDTNEPIVKEGAFTTAASNRFVYLPGVVNTRDIGGYYTSFGKKVKQGMLIRGSDIDGLVVSDYYLTDKSAADEFGFVYDMDLRGSDTFSDNYVSRLGSTVKHKFYGAPTYGNIFNKNSYSTLRTIFADLADASNYPMYMHCTHGADRTGTIVFLLQGILGVAEEDIDLEYKLTAFSLKGYEDGSKLDVIYSGLEGIEGDSINEKIENFLVGTVGVTKEQIQSIRDILLEK